MASASSVLSQSVLKPSDASEAVEIAHRFAESLDRHKDIAPSLNNLFAKDFIARFRYNCANSHFLKMLDPKVAKKATSHELKSFGAVPDNQPKSSLTHCFNWVNCK